MTIIWGNAIGLRPFEDNLTDDEIARVYQWSRDENVLRWSGGTPTDLTFNEFRERLLNDRGHMPSNRRAFFIITRDSEIIGRIGCFAIDWKKKEGIPFGDGGNRTKQRAFYAAMRRASTSAGNMSGVNWMR